MKHFFELLLKFLLKTLLLKFYLYGAVINVSKAETIGFGRPITILKRDMPASDIDDSRKYVGLYDDECSETILLTPTKNEAEIEPDKSLLEQSSTTCHWNIIGADNCVPTLTCKKFKLEAATGDKEDPCPEEYFQVTDGSSGFQRFCGDKGPDQITNGKKLRDFYVTLKTSENSKIKKRSLVCEVICNPGKAVGTPLKTESEPEVDETCNCGRKPNSDRIVGGEDAKRGEFPWMAALVAAGSRKPFCGATVINNRFVLTAAHCFKGPYIQGKNLQVLLNAHNMDLTSSSVAKGEGGSNSDMTPDQLKAADAKENSKRFSVDRYFMHPLYIRQTNDFDVALIKLDKPIDFKTTKEVSPACLPGLGSYEQSKEGVAAIVAGWGLNHSEATVTMSVLQKLDVKVFKNSECKGFFDTRFTRRMLCAGHKEAGKDSCKGDSGGPLISEKTKQVWEQIGVVSWGEGCAEGNKPGVYANTREVIQWIRYVSNMEDAVWCSG